MLPIVLTASLTLIGGCLLYFFNQVISKLIIEPYLAYRTLLGDICYRLACHQSLIISGRYEHSPEKHMEVAALVKDLAARLKATAAACPVPGLLRAFRLIPKRKVIQEAAGLLCRISHRLQENEKKHDEIYKDFVMVAKLLRIELETEY